MKINYSIETIYCGETGAPAYIVAGHRGSPLVGRPIGYRPIDYRYTEEQAIDLMRACHKAFLERRAECRARGDTVSYG